MALNNLGMGIVFTAKDLASQVVHRLGNSFGGLDDTVGGVSERMAKKLGISVDTMTMSLKTLTAGLAIATVGVAGLGAGFALASKSEKFEEGLAGASAIMRATTTELGLLKAAAIDAGIATQFSPTEAIEGLQSLGAAGQTARQATATLIPVLDLAAASLGQLGVAGSAEAVVGTLNAYSMSADQAAGVTDRLVRITQISNFQARDFASGLSTAAAAGATFNQDLNTVLVTMGLLRNANIDASRAATSFREATSRLGSDTRAQSAITKVGVNVFDRVTGKMRNLIDITRDFARATKGLTDEQRLSQVKIAFGQRGLLAFSAISGATAEKIAELRSQLEGAGGAAEEFRKKMLATLGGQKKLLKGTIDTIGVVVGDGFAKILAPAVETVVVSLNSMLKVFRDLPESVKTGGALTFMFGSLALVIGGLVTAGTALATVFGGAIAGAFATAAPFIGAILAGLALLGAEIVVLKTAWESNFGGIRDTALSVFSQIQAAVSAVMPFVMAAFEGASSALREVFSGVIGAIEPVFADIISTAKAAFSSLMEGIAPIAEALGFTGPGATAMAVIKAVASFMVKNFFRPATIFIKIFSFGIRQVLFGFRAVFKVILAIKRFFTPLVTSLIGIAKIVGGFLMDFLGITRVIDMLKTAFKTVYPVVVQVFLKIKAAIIESINFVIRAINSVIEKAAAAAFVLSPNRDVGNKQAQEILGLKIGEIGATGTATETQQTTTATTPTEGLGSRGGALVPAASPVGGGAAQAPGLSENELARLVNAVISAQENRPVVIHGEAILDGEAVGEIRAARESDMRARQGQSRLVFGG